MSERWSAACPPHLFRRHVPDGSEDSARLCLRTGFAGSAFWPKLVRRRQLGQTEVENLQLSILGDEQILRFQIAMNDVRIVGGGQTACRLDGVIQRLASGYP